MKRRRGNKRITSEYHTERPTIKIGRQEAYDTRREFKCNGSVSIYTF